VEPADVDGPPAVVVAPAVVVVPAVVALVAAEPPLLLSPPHAAATMPIDTKMVVGTAHRYRFTHAPLRSLGGRSLGFGAR
jgi:hypothetical protein